MQNPKDFYPSVNASLTSLSMMNKDGMSPQLKSIIGSNGIGKDENNDDGEIGTPPGMDGEQLEDAEDKLQKTAMQWNNQMRIGEDGQSAVKVDFGGSFKIVPEATEAAEATNNDVLSPIPESDRPNSFAD